MMKGPFSKLLPPPQADQYTIVLDLDETVIYARYPFTYPIVLASFPQVSLKPHGSKVAGSTRTSSMHFLAASRSFEKLLLCFVCLLLLAVQLLDMLPLANSLHMAPSCA